MTHDEGACYAPSGVNVVCTAKSHSYSPGHHAHCFVLKILLCPQCSRPPHHLLFGFFLTADIYGSSIFLTHWGRRDSDHKSNTAFTPDNYTQEYVHPMQDKGWLHLIEGHPCYTPGKVRIAGP